MNSLSIKSISIKSWSIFQKHWRVLALASLIPLLLSVLERFVFSFYGLFGDLVSIVILVLGFLVYIFQTMYILDILHNSDNVSWKAVLHKMTFKKIWRLIKANVWMVFIIVWPAILMVSLAYVFGMLVGSNTYSGTTLSVVIIGAMTVIGGLNAFLRSLKYALALYLGFTTHNKITNLTIFSRELMRGNRIKLLKLIFVSIVLSIGSVMSIVLVPLVQPLIYIALVVFAERIVAKSKQEELEVQKA